MTSQSLLSNQLYGYDNAGRLVDVKDTYLAACTERRYSYDVDSNRLGLVSVAPGVAGACTGLGAQTATTHTYNAADQVTDAGYTFDAFGRATVVPAAYSDSGQSTLVAYYANDLVQSIQSGAGAARLYGLDPLLRLTTQTDGTAPGAVVHTNHYNGDGDSPSWIAETADGSTWTRVVPDLGAGVFALQAGAPSSPSTSYQLVNLHGDVVAVTSSDPAAASPVSTQEQTEFGVPRPGGSSTRYGWLGSRQRPTDTTGLVLMGLRLYTPSQGRFLQVDPVPGGSANAYDYVDQNPIGASDLSGTMLPSDGGGGGSASGLAIASSVVAKAGVAQSVADSAVMVRSQVSTTARRLRAGHAPSRHFRSVGRATRFLAEHSTAAKIIRITGRVAIGASIVVGAAEGFAEGGRSGAARGATIACMSVAAGAAVGAVCEGVTIGFGTPACIAAGIGVAAASDAVSAGVYDHVVAPVAKAIWTGLSSLNPF